MFSGFPRVFMIRVVRYKQALPALVADKPQFSTVEIERYEKLHCLRSGIRRGYDPARK